MDMALCRMEEVNVQKPAFSGPVNRHCGLNRGTSNPSSAEASTIGPRAAAGPLLRQASRGCRHCVSCCRLQHHRHSTTYRSGHDTGAEWWPGGLQSPNLYFHLRARQLQHQIKYPNKAAHIWRHLDEEAISTSELLSRRKQNPLRVQIPVACTNVPQADMAIQCLGEKIVKVPVPRGERLSLSSFGDVPRIESNRCHVMGSSHTPGFKPDGSHGSSRADQLHASTCQSLEPMELDKSDQVDPKRRCTEITSQMNPNRCTSGHFIAVAATGVPSSYGNAGPFSAPDFTAVRNDVPVYPGKVLHETCSSCPLDSKVMSSGSGSFGGLVATAAPLSAGSEASSSSSASIADLGLSMGIESRTLSKTSSLYWENTPGSFIESSSVPVLIPVVSSSLHVATDSSLLGYYRKQAMIKDEHAFPCHQVLDIGSISTESSAGGGLHLGQQNSGNPLGSMFRTIAGTLKRNSSP